jgi:hypothetical protein
VKTEVSGLLLGGVRKNEERTKKERRRDGLDRLYSPDFAGVLRCLPSESAEPHSRQRMVVFVYVRLINVMLFLLVY